MMNYRCSGCGESGIAPGACDRCNCEYLPDETGAIDGVPQQLHRRPWRHFVIANATTAFTNIYVDDRWLDGAGHLIKLGSLVVLGFLLFLPLTLIPDGYRTLHVVLAQVWILATLVLNTVLWSLFSARVGGLSYRAYAAVVMSERAIRASSRFTSVAAVTEGPAILVGETTPVETVSREGADPVLAIQGFEATGTLRDDPALQYDGSAPRMRPSIGGDFLLSDGSGSPISVRAEHVVIESPRLDLCVPVGSRVAASGNVVWVPGEEGYRGGHGHWEMVGSWDQPVILRVLRAGPDPTAAPTGIRVDVASEATTQAPGVASTTADNEAAEVPGADRKVDVRRG
ncbi:MAG: hypothetical protein IPF99_37460 [Deltaproteobacteria bacterium]|nr:hypothetical protein [Deltaproteobacteria bacterium]